MSVIEGRVFKYGDDVNTDVIFPGKYTYTLREWEEIRTHALEDLDPDFTRLVGAGDVIVAGTNFGCGSSREQAVTCLKLCGVGAIVARSFARIYYRNAINNGLPAIACPEAVDALEHGDQILIDLDAQSIETNAGAFHFPPFSSSVRELLACGGLIERTRRRLQESSIGA